MKATDEFIAMMDRERAEATLRYNIEQLTNLINEALVELRRPLDTEAVLDNHAGRALWLATQAGKATRILCRAELPSFGDLIPTTGCAKGTPHEMHVYQSNGQPQRCPGIATPSDVPTPGDDS